MVELKAKKTVDDIDPKGKKVLVRCDFNVPLKDGEILNDFRIRSTLPTIKAITDRGGCAILMSHHGRPKPVPTYDGSTADASGYVESESLKPVAARLEELLGGETKVTFAPDCLDAKAAVDSLEEGGVLLLENVRFYANESSKKEDERLAMAKTLASYGDVYVSDAFGTAHRDSATMTGIPKVLGAGYAGYLIKKEVDAFGAVLGDPPKPVVAIVGGAKVSDKILLLENMLPKIDRLLIGGAMAYTFLQCDGKTVGSSMSEAGKTFKAKDGTEQKVDDLVATILTKAKEANVDVYLPTDHVCHTTFGPTDSALVTEDANIPDGYMALDIGPKTVAKYMEVIAGCKTAIWNGPMGVFEMDCYSNGTFSVAKAMGDGTAGDMKLMSIIGGGDSASAAEQCGEAKRMSHVSTGGGASLELLEGKVLPGLAALDDA
uniref:Phosphoglycerate kinase n=1 Tax=Pseudictyota dubia TaxID=2749911 RepID=A0A7R9VLR6_9STRA|mmetsp:Transcript_17989/g.33529  ORF Transcript_17989/g.33529 Transcript_17989/m.33529 type:complete len:432 (+) Transcript_17989:80-1375(+)